MTVRGLGLAIPYVVKGRDGRTYAVSNIVRHLTQIDGPGGLIVAIVLDGSANEQHLTWEQLVAREVAEVLPDPPPTPPQDSSTPLDRLHLLWNQWADIYTASQKERDESWSRFSEDLEALRNAGR